MSITERIPVLTLNLGGVRMGPPAPEGVFIPWRRFKEGRFQAGTAAVLGLGFFLYCKLSRPMLPNGGGEAAPDMADPVVPTPPVVVPEPPVVVPEPPVVVRAPPVVVPTAKLFFAFCLGYLLCMLSRHEFVAALGLVFLLYMWLRPGPPNDDGGGAPEEVPATHLPPILVPEPAPTPEVPVPSRRRWTF